MLPFRFHQNGSDDLVLGHIGPYSIFPKFRISQKVRRFHSYVVGLTGRGKSKFLQNCIVQDVVAGRGCAVIDPHGDLAKDVLRTFAELTGLNIVVHPSTSCTVTLELRDVHWDQALDVILAHCGLATRREGGVLMVGTRG